MDAKNMVVRGLGTLAVLWLGARWFEWKSVFHPSRTLRETPAAAGLEFEDVSFVSEDAKVLHGWWIPHPQARGTILYCHGNAGNIGGRVGVGADLHRLGVNVFLFDYRGYGRSRGWPSEQGTYRDARAAFEVVRARYADAEQPPVVVFGSSLGGAVAAQLALDKPVRGLVVDSSFTSIRDMGERLYPWLPVRLVCRYRYDTLAKIPRLSAPLLVAHSREDDLVPYEMGQRLFAAAPEPKQFVAFEGGHDESGWTRSPDYARALAAFLDRTLGPRPAGEK